MIFKNKVHWSSLCNKVPACWFKPASGTAEQNYKYVRKIRAEDLIPNAPETFFEQGLRPNFEAATQQRREAQSKGAEATAELWEQARELARDGRFDEIPAQLYIQHMRNFQLIYREERNKRTPIEDFELREWQQELLNILEGPVDNRKIYWYWEEVGNVGKSWMATFLLRNYDAITVSSGKTADIAYLLDQPKIVVFDIARDAIDHVNFGVMEDIKNGRVFSPKYESAVKSFDVPHLVVFANCPCPHGKFSADRLQTINLSEWRPNLNLNTPINLNLNAALAPGFVLPGTPPPRPVLRRSEPITVGSPEDFVMNLDNDNWVIPNMDDILNIRDEDMVWDINNLFD